MWEKSENKEKEAGFGPFFKKEGGWVRSNLKEIKKWNKKSSAEYDPVVLFYKTIQTSCCFKTIPTYLPTYVGATYDVWVSISRLRTAIIILKSNPPIR